MASPICFVNTTKSWGGGERWHFETALAMKEQGVNVHFVCQVDSELELKLKKKKFSILKINVSNLSFLNPFLILKLKSFFEYNKIDTVVLNTSIDLKLAGIAAKLAGLRRIIYRRGSAIPIKNKWLNRYLLRSVATDILANSEETKRTVLSIKSNFLSEDKIKVVYNGLNIQEYDKSSFIDEIKSRENTIVIGNLGRLVYQKGQEYLVDLASELRKRNVNFQIKIGGEGELRSELENQIKRRELEALVILTGYVDEPAKFMAGVDVFVLSSRWEGFGYVLVEAMLSKKPCIAFDLSSNPELIENDENGFLVEPYNIQELADKVESLAKDRYLRDRLGSNGRKLAEQKFDADKILPQLLSFLLE